MDRYIAAQAIQVAPGELISVFDERIQFVKDDYYGNHVRLNGDHRMFRDFIDCVYDLKARQLKAGIVKDFYPNIEELPHKVGDRCLVEIGHHKMQLTKLKEVVFEEFTSSFRKGKKIEQYETQRYFAEGEVVDANAIYQLRYWEPIYVFENGFKTKYDHQIHELVE